MIECDLGDQQKLQELLFQEWPDVLINCSEEAIDEEKMASSNTHLPKFLSQLTHHLGTRFIHIQVMPFLMAQTLITIALQILQIQKPFTDKQNCWAKKKFLKIVAQIP